MNDLGFHGLSTPSVQGTSGFDKQRSLDIQL